MSIIDQQKELEYYPDDVLAQEMMQPTGIAPSFLVATEIKRRNDMRNSYEMQMNQPPQMSVAEEQAMELQGIPDIDPNMMQQQMMQDPMMQEQMPQNAPMQMREGGDIRYQEGEDIDFDETGGFFRDGINYVTENPFKTALGVASIASMLTPIGAARGAGMGLARLLKNKDAIAKALSQSKDKIYKGAQSFKDKQLRDIGTRTATKRGLIPQGSAVVRDPVTGRMVGTKSLGEETLKKAGQYVNPMPLNLSNPFVRRTLPVGFIGSQVGGALIPDDVEPSIGGSVEASTEDAITQDNIQSLQDAIQQERDNETTDQVLNEGVETGMETEAGKMLASAMENVPEDTTFQEYLDALQGMEATRQSQILMDLGASIANASHGGDIAKGFQEAGTKARTEQLNIAKERARVMGESRARDIDIGLKISDIDAALKKSNQITLSGWLDLFADNPELIDAIRDADDPVDEIITILDRLGVNTENMKRAKDNQDKNE